MKTTLRQYVFIMALFFCQFLYTVFPQSLNIFLPNCKAEQNKFCNNLQTPRIKLVQCLLEHNNDLSDDCKSNLAEYSEKIRSKSKKLCSEDVNKYCKWIMPGGGRMIKCLFKNENSLSESCKALLNE